MSDSTKKAWVGFFIATAATALGVAVGMTIYNDVLKRWVIK